jgi:predicted transposase YdaD
MPYVTSIERIGIEQGKETERQSIALNLLRENVPLEIVSRTTGLMIEQLQQLQTEQENDRSFN